MAGSQDPAPAGWVSQADPASIAKSAIFPISRVKPYKETDDVRQLKKMGLVKVPDKAEVIQDHHYEVSRILGHHDFHD